MSPGVLRDLLARVVSARESLAFGDVEEAAVLLADLEHDLAAVVQRLEEDVVR